MGFFGVLGAVVSAPVKLASVPVRLGEKALDAVTGGGEEPYAEGGLSDPILEAGRSLEDMLEDLDED
jgi:hypothetical protein